MVRLATNAVTSVPKGTVTAMLVPLTTPIAAGLVNENTVITLAEDRGADGIQSEGGGPHLFNNASAENNGKRGDDRDENKKEYLFD